MIQMSGKKFKGNWSPKLNFFPFHYVYKLVDKVFLRRMDRQSK